MDLTLSGDLVKQLLTVTKNDTKLVQAMARQFIDAVDNAALAEYLLTPEAAEALLAERIMNNPEGTIADLQSLPESTGRAPRRGPVAKARQPRKAGPKATRTAGAKGKQRRHRLSADEIDSLKSQVLDVLSRNPWSTRKEIATAVSFPSLAAYNRIMGELKEADAITSVGEKSKTVYALQGAAPAQAGNNGQPTAAKGRGGRKAAKKATGATKAAPKERKKPGRKPKNRVAKQKGRRTRG